MESKKYYSAERGVQILISLLKANGIKRVIASPGTTNLSVVGSLMCDPFFEIYSAADERSACYMACGMAAESGEPVVISCTGATASRNYMPGLTEAYYRKLPILAIPANSGFHNAGHLIAQYIDRRVEPNDVCVFHTDVPAVHDSYTEWAANVAINTAILALTRNGGGPAIINYSNEYSRDYSVKKLPKERVINRICSKDIFPELPNGKIAIFIGSHNQMSDCLTTSIDKFCASNDSVVLCDLTSGYHGRFAVNSSLICGQSGQTSIRDIDLLIHIGEVSGDYYTMGIKPKTVWRVSEDGEVRDFFHTLRYVFDMEEITFFEAYSNENENNISFLETCRNEELEISNRIPNNLPFSNVWIAKESSHLIPDGSLLHLGILNTLRSWNFFTYPSSVQSYCNTGGFGIDGILSTAIGASLGSPDKICYCILGDLAFFYDMNSLANRHIASNMRVMLINNGRGTEFTNFNHPGHDFGKDADKYIAAAGHYGNKSHELVRHYAKDLGYEYLSADNKKQFLDNSKRFFTPDVTSRPMFFEIFTDSKDESDALKIMLNLIISEGSIKSGIKSEIKNVVRSVLGEKAIKIAKIIKDS